MKSSRELTYTIVIVSPAIVRNYREIFDPDEVVYRIIFRSRYGVILREKLRKKHRLIE